MGAGVAHAGPGMFDLATSVPVQQTPASVLTEAIVYELSGGAVRARPESL